MEKPILFNTTMVQAILQGNKTTTRRIVKSQPKHSVDNVSMCDGIVSFNERELSRFDVCESTIVKKPYKVGDTIWVRETWQESECFDYNMKDQYCYKADNATNEYAEQFNIKWRPSIHMPRVAARLFLKVTDVRVERLQDMTEVGAKAEGIRGFSKDGELYKYSHTDEFVWIDAPSTATEAFKMLWNPIYFKQSNGWNENPWVWIIEFENI